MINTYGYASFAAVYRTTLQTDLSLSECFHRMCKLYQIFGITGNRSFEGLYEVLSDTDNIDKLIGEVKDNDEMIVFIPHFVGMLTKMDKGFAEFSIKELQEQLVKFFDDPVKRMCKHIYGLETVKSKIYNIITRVKFMKIREINGLKSIGNNLIFVFSGPPGVGKTDMANYMCQIMVSNGILPGSRFTSISAAQLKAEYVGQTTHRVVKLFEENDAILIDECYSLAAQGDSGIDSYSQEAFAQLCVEIEKHSKDKLIIFAGYGSSNGKNPMKQFLDANQGIRSRISDYIDFPPYSPCDDLPKIFKLMADNADFDLEDGWRDIMVDYFLKKSELPSFGNAREARKVLNQAITLHSGRVDLDSFCIKDLREITCDDLNDAIKSILSNEDCLSLNECTKRKLGFNM